MASRVLNSARLGPLQRAHAWTPSPAAAREPGDMNRGHISSSELIDAKLEEHRISTARHCPNCRHKLDCKPDWLGLPAGVKFDPTDQELIEHLEAKVREEGSRSHPLIHEFIPTIDGEDGICYTHPEKLPGVTMDGLSKHFFHRPSKAYTTGTRKRRKIQTECDVHKGETRWHKTGKTRPVMANGRQKGCKKILVLYTNFGKHRKPEKTNWVMHQYHLGDLEEEKEGELVVCKIFYQTQPRQCSWSASSDRGGAGGAVAIAAAAAVTVQEQRMRDSGSGSSSSRDHEALSATSYPSGYAMAAAVEMQHLKHSGDHFSFAPFRKSFEEVGIGGDQVPSDHLGRSEHQQHAGQEQQPHRPDLATTAMPATAFLVSRPMNPISATVPPPLQHTSVVLDHDQFHVPAIFLHHDKFQNMQQQQQQKIDRRSAGLEELVMGCTSTCTKGETSIPHSQETEWPYPYWPPDNQDHHG